MSTLFEYHDKTEYVKDGIYKIFYKKLIVPIKLVHKTKDLYGSEIFKMYMGEKYIGEFNGGYDFQLASAAFKKITRALNLIQEKASMIPTTELIDFIKINFGVECKIA